MDPLEDAEVQELLRLLDRAIHDTRRSRREIERSLGLGQGYLSSLFRGRIELKVWHVYRLARELGHDPLKFFFKVSPPQDPKWVHEHLGLAPEVTRAKQIEKAPPPLGPTLDMLVTRGELDNLVRRTIREELARIKDDDPEEPEEDGDEPEDPFDPEEP